MAQEERYFSRDRSYSAWHRRMSIRRYVGIESAQTMAMIDLDSAGFVEYDDRSKEPLFLVEAARDVGQYSKTATVTRNLARRAELPAYVLLYNLCDGPNPADSSVRDISGFRAKRLWPPEGPADWKHFSPDEWATHLVRIRQYCASKLDDRLNGGSFERILGLLPDLDPAQRIRLLERLFDGFTRSQAREWVTRLTDMLNDDNDEIPF